LIQSLLVGVILAGAYSYYLHQSTLRARPLSPQWRFQGVLRIVIIGLIFVALAEFTALLISQVLIAFISVFSLYLFKQAAGAILSGQKKVGSPQRRI